MAISVDLIAQAVDRLASVPGVLMDPVDLAFVEFLMWV